MRVVRTFAFLDLCGFTAYTDAHGDNEAVAVLGRLRAGLRAEAESHGVRVTKWLGDGAMLSGVEAGAVITCAHQVRAQVQAQGPLPLRGGICEGEVIMFEGDDYIGAAVNFAARLCDEAAAHQVLVEDATARHVPPARRPRPVRCLRLDGFSRDIQAHEIVRLDATPVAPAAGP